MSPINFLLGNLGHPLAPALKDTVTVYPAAQGDPDDPASVQDAEGNYVKTPVGPGVSYPAIVTRQPAAVSDTDGTVQGVSTFSVMIFAPTIPPGLTAGSAMTWTAPGGAERTLEAAGDPISAGPGAWQVDAASYGPQAGTPGPANEAG